MSIYFELTRKFNSSRTRAILAGGQTVVLHRLAIMMSKDEELETVWTAWFYQAQITNDEDRYTYSHGVFTHEPVDEADYGLTAVPSGLRTGRQKPGSCGSGNFAASSSLRSTPKPGASLMCM